MTYIYKIENIINNKCYIGKTEYGIERRLREHITASKQERNKNRPLYRAFNKYGAENFQIELLEVAENGNEREISYIEKYKTYNGCGYNATKGGDGKAYLDYSNVIKDYHSGLTIQDTAIKNKMSYDSVRFFLRKNNVEIVSSQELSKKKNSKIVLMYDKVSCKLLNTFDSLTAAANYLIENKLTNCKVKTMTTHISEVCRGKRKSAAGFKWSFA